jgi:hypothetical protein
MDIADLEDESTKQYEVEDPDDLYYLCDKVTDAEFEAEMHTTWESCEEDQLNQTCRSIRKHVYANDIPRLEDKKKQEPLTEIEAMRDKNDWILDPKHVYRRSILKASSPSRAEPVQRMEKHYRPTWNPSILERDWQPPLEAV